INVVIDDSSPNRVTNVEEDVETSLQQTDNSESEEDSGFNTERTSPESDNAQANKGP
ncbi:hypothetical protein A2U01_0068481, partial [Trifolium medium]|nr:hypothetical protein [Trifolium medium]